MAWMAPERSASQGVALLLALGGAAVALLWSVLPAGDILERLELRTIDARFVARGPRSTSGHVVILEVDDASLESLGAWPWPRERFAVLLDRLAAHGARAVAFDILFSEPSPGPRGAASDEALAEATRRFPATFHAAAGEVAPEAQPSSPGPMEDALVLPGARVEAVSGLNQGARLREVGQVIGPLPKLARASRRVGLVDVLPSRDGVFRSYLPVMLCGKQLCPSLALALAMEVLGVRPEEVRVRPGRAVHLGAQRAIPIDAHGSMLIDFAGPSRTFPYYSAAAVMGEPPKVPRDAFRDKVVLVAVTATGLYDLRACPFATVFNGVETQANALDNMLTGRFLRRQRPELVLLYTLAWGLVIGFVAPRCGAWGQVGLSVGLVVLHNAIAYWHFVSRGVATDMVVPTLGIGFALATVGAYRLILQERRHALVRRTFSRFLPPEIADTLVENGAPPVITGERRVVTVLFADLRGFTRASAQMVPEDTVSLLNRYFALMHEVILSFDGTLDKFMGDGLMAFWNAPRDQLEHAGLAVAAALEMQRRVEVLRDEWAFHGMPDLRVSIGISTGECVVGYVGSGERMQYTAIGLEVNVASRLEGLAKERDARVLISQATYDLVSDTVVAVPLGRVQLHGIDQETVVYEVTGLRVPETA